MEVFAVEMGPHSQDTNIPFFGIVRKTVERLPLYALKGKEGYVKILEQKPSEPIAFGPSVAQRWSWAYVSDPSEASRFTTQRAAEIFQSHCGGPRKGIVHQVIIREVGRPTESPSGKVRETVTIRLDPDLRDRAKAHGIKLGPLLEKAIIAALE
jgi:uncharacterized protein (DUF4415 family)